MTKEMLKKCIKLWEDDLTFGDYDQTQKRFIKALIDQGKLELVQKENK